MQNGYELKTTDFMPKKLSTCLMTALADLERVENDRRFKIDMTDWCEFKDKFGDAPQEPCSVCFAGAVMAQRGLAKRGKGFFYTTPDKYNRWNQDRFFALNDLREGAISDAIMRVHPEVGCERADEIQGYFREYSLDSYGGQSYESDKKAWKETMLMIAGVLKAEGL